MPVRLRRDLKRRGYTHAHAFQLVVGWEWFGDAFGTDREAMHKAWADPAMREQVFDLCEQRRVAGSTRELPWAELEFA